jgi:hypothetical protein
VLTKTNLPHARFMDQDFFIVKEEKGLFSYIPITLVRPKGQAFISNLVKDPTNPYISIFDEKKKIKECEQQLKLALTEFAN